MNISVFTNTLLNYVLTLLIPRYDFSWCSCGFLAVLILFDGHQQGPAHF